jgi:hypothetical protein
LNVNACLTRSLPVIIVHHLRERCRFDGKELLRCAASLKPHHPELIADVASVVATGIAFSSGHLWHKHDRISRVEAANGLADFSDHAANPDALYADEHLTCFGFWFFHPPEFNLSGRSHHCLPHSIHIFLLDE